MANQFEVVIVGAGVVGLACAKQFAEKGFDTLVVESEDAFGTGISSRNSEVIHAGIYYSSNTAKARLCVRGRHLLYEYCSARGIAHKKIGKWIVAQTHNQAEKLHKLHKTGESNGCDDLYFLDTEAIRSGEPELNATDVLYSPSTGIVDSHALMYSMVGDVANSGGVIVYRTPCTAARQLHDGFELRLGGVEPTTVTTRFLVNACGLNAVNFAKKIDGLADDVIPQACYAKGNYFSYTGKVPFRRLIYPTPETGGLGVHLTLDLNGQARFGPDVEWIDEIDYQVNESAKLKFAAAIKTYWPACRAENLTPAYAGVRPKLGNRYRFAEDFYLQSEKDHGIPGLFNLFGIESPGLTASLAIAEEVFSTFREMS